MLDDFLKVYQRLRIRFPWFDNGRFHDNVIMIFPDIIWNLDVWCWDDIIKVACWLLLLWRAKVFQQKGKMVISKVHFFVCKGLEIIIYWSISQPKFYHCYDYIVYIVHQTSLWSVDILLFYLYNYCSHIEISIQPDIQHLLGFNQMWLLHYWPSLSVCVITIFINHFDGWWSRWLPCGRWELQCTWP